MKSTPALIRITRHLVPIVTCLALAADAGPAARADQAAAYLHSTDSARVPLGEAALEDTDQGLKIDVTVRGVSPGLHGLHIHRFGSCGESGEAAGPHYNPGNLPHGDVVSQGILAAHAGDLGNIEIGPDGSGRLTRFVPGLRLSDGEFTVGGRSLILHEREDDFGQPAGNAGPRIGCGTIYLVDSTAT